MKEWLVVATAYVVTAINWLALIVIVIATIEAFVRGAGALFRDLTGHQRRAVWLRFGRWLVASLTFQLAADILESAVATDWDSVGRLAAVAVIRTFLNYFLERDLDDIREKEKSSTALTALPE